MNPLLIRRRGMMQARQGGDGRLDWIETDGAAWINLYKTPTPWCSCEAKLIMPSHTSLYYPIGAHRSSSHQCAFMGLTTGGLLTFKYSNSNVTGYSFNNSVYNIIKTSFVSTTDKSISYTPEGGSETTQTYTTQTGTNSMVGFYWHIFNFNNVRSPQGTRLWYAKIYSDAAFSNLQLHLVPWLYNGEVGLMDILTNTFYGNAAGIGAFTGGLNVI